jgi:CHAT domain-containing protein
VYLLVRRERDRLYASLLTAGDKATVVSGEKTISNLALENQLMRLASVDLDPPELRRFGRALGRLLLPKDLLALLDTMPDRHVVVVHDRESSQIPWETLALSRNAAPALGGGMSRRYMAGGLSIAKWLEQRRREKTLSVLLVANPTNDLPSADAEGRRLEVLAQHHPGVKLTSLRRKQATKATLLKLFQSGDFDLVHYAGHAFFDAASPESSGIVCAGGQVLSGRELSGLGNLPSLVFFNACEAGRIRRAPSLSLRKRVEVSVGLAEAFLRGGVANYVGTYWPVGDDSAKAFAASFYRDLLVGRSIGDALLAARHELHRLDSIDWADYIHYGDYHFSLKSI